MLLGFVCVLGMEMTPSVYTEAGLNMKLQNSIYRSQLLYVYNSLYDYRISSERIILFLVLELACKQRLLHLGYV